MFQVCLLISILSKTRQRDLREPLLELLMNLPIGTPGKITVLNEELFPIIKQEEDRKALCPGGPTEPCWASKFPLSCPYTTHLLSLFEAGSINISSLEKINR